jgi:integrase
LRINEALALGEADLDHRRGALLVRRGKGGRRGEVLLAPRCDSERVARAAFRALR